MNRYKEMNEFERISNKFFRKDNKAIVYYDLDQELFSKVIDQNNIRSYERPDILSIFDNKIIGIEHFEFDSFKKSHKGSNYKIEDNSIKRNFQETVNKELINKKSITVHDEIKSTPSLDNYFSNFKNNFIQHYNKVDDYIDHIEKKFDCSNKKVSICFFAEDVSPLGSYFLDKKRKTNLLNPLYSDDIIKLLENCPKVKYIIIGTYATSEHKLIIIENKKSVLKRFKQEKPKINKSDFMSFTPQTTGFAMRITTKEIEEHKNKQAPKNIHNNIDK